MHVVCICTCSAQLSMFHMERRSRNTLIIIMHGCVLAGVCILFIYFFNLRDKALALPKALVYMILRLNYNVMPMDG